MKKLLVFVTIGFFCLGALNASPAFAVRMISGSVPETKPLQPIPEDIQPNLKENVQSQNSPLETNGENQPADGQNSSPNLSTGGEKAGDTPGAAADRESDFFQDALVLAIILAVAVGGGSAVYLRARGRLKS